MAFLSGSLGTRWWRVLITVAAVLALGVGFGRACSRGDDRPDAAPGTTGLGGTPPGTAAGTIGRPLPTAPPGAPTPSIPPVPAAVCFLPPAPVTDPEVPASGTPGLTVALSGRVLDGACRSPVSDLVIWVYKAETPDATMDAVAAFGTTDATGTFRVEVPPGAYRVGAQDPTLRAYAFVWYPEAADAPGATTIDVRSDRRLDDLLIYRPPDQPIPPFAGTGPRRIAVIGDSLAQQSATPINGALAPLGAVSIRGVANQRVDQLQPVASRYAAADPDVVVIALGNNDVLQVKPVTESMAAMTTMMNSFPASTCFVVLTVNTRTGDAAFNLRALVYNDELARQVTGRPNAHLADWSATVGMMLLSRPEPSVWFSDGLHLQPEGMTFYASTMAQGIGTC